MKSFVVRLWGGDKDLAGEELMRVLLGVLFRGLHVWFLVGASESEGEASYLLLLEKA